MAGDRATLRVLIADDNRAVRKGLRLILDGTAGIQVIGEVSNGHDAVCVARAEQPDVVLMDLHMPGMTGLAATRELARPEREQPVAVVVMTSYGSDKYVTAALEAGAVGYLLKGHDSDQLVPAIRAAARGEALLSTRVMVPVLERFARRPSTMHADGSAAQLSPAERRVVALLARGVTSNEAIARELHLSVHTVRSQLQSALKKVGAEDRTQLALWGVRHRLYALTD